MAKEEPGGRADQRNKRAPEMNPEKSGIRSGNPQLETSRGGKQADDPRGSPKEHRPPKN